MKGERTMKKRDDFCRSTVDRAIEAIDKNRSDEAKDLAREIWEETRPVHDQYGDLMGFLFTYIANKLGEEAVEDVHRYMAEAMWKPMLEALKDDDTSAFVKMVAFYLRTHGFSFSCYENHEQYEFILHYCPSGGRMIKEGKNDNSDRHHYNFGTTKKPYPWSFNRTDISYYCCHCALWMDILPREWGWDVIEAHFGKQFDDTGSPIDDPCKMIIYKTPQ